MKLEHYKYLYLVGGRGFNYRIVSDNGITIHEFSSNNREEAMKLADNYCSSWPHILIKWIEEKDAEQKATN